MVWPFSSPLDIDPSTPHVPVNSQSIDLLFNPKLNNKRGEKFQRLIVAFDGTWQQIDEQTRANPSDPDPSNVSRFVRSVNIPQKGKYDEYIDVDVKLADMSDGKAQVRQLTKYIKGVGTKKGIADKFLGGIFGWGVDENIRKGFRWLCKHYNAGDEIIFIGFSRGAFTARSLAGFVHGIGILRAPELDPFKDTESYSEKFRNEWNATLRPRFDEIWQAYKQPASTPAERTRRFRRYMETRVYGYPLFLNVPIKGIGVWDTVGSLGIPIKKGGILEGFEKIAYWKFNREYQFHNVALGLGVENAFHAIALDEQRYAYRPTMWYREEDKEHIDEAEIDPTNGEHLRRKALESLVGKPNILQVWFPGVHIDIGGGTSGGRYPEFSDMTLLWMMDQFDRRGLLNFKAGRVEEIVEKAKTRLPRPEKIGLMAKVKGFFTRFLSSPASKPSTNEVGPGEHDGLLRAKPSSASGTIGTSFAGMEPRNPGRWTNFDGDLDALKEEYHGKFPDRSEFIHAIVRQRYEIGVGLPASLDGFTFQDRQWHGKDKDGSPVVVDEYTGRLGEFEMRLYGGDDDTLLHWRPPTKTSQQPGISEPGQEGGNTTYSSIV